jgi:hypothetical protein
MSDSHFHIGYGIAGYGPDVDEGAPTLGSWEDVCDYLHAELSTVVDMIGEDAEGHAARGDYETAWNTSKRADAVDILRRSLDPKRAVAPLYRDDPGAWRATIERTVRESFPLDTSGAIRLYVWECSEDECEDEDA